MFLEKFTDWLEKLTAKDYLKMLLCIIAVVLVVKSYAATRDPFIKPSKEMQKEDARQLVNDAFATYIDNADEDMLDLYAFFNLYRLDDIIVDIYDELIENTEYQWEETIGYRGESTVSKTVDCIYDGYMYGSITYTMLDTHGDYYNTETTTYIAGCVNVFDGLLYSVYK